MRESLLPWIPILVSILAFLSGVVIYAWQRKVDRSNDLFVQRRAAYSDLLKALNRQLANKNIQNHSTLTEARGQVLLIASDDVAQAVGSFFNEAQKVKRLEDSGEQISSEILLKTYAEMIIAMRSDTFERTKLSIEEIILAAPLRYSEKHETQS